MDAFELFNLTVHATPAEVKLAHKRLALKLHPDKGGDRSAFQELGEANATLNDPAKRQAHCESLRPVPAGSAVRLVNLEGQPELNGREGRALERGGLRQAVALPDRVVSVKRNRVTEIPRGGGARMWSTQ
eukprot:9498635-Pyramimonas_sp.AAC.1